MTDLNSDMNSSYQNLTNEIKNTVDDNERLFREMRSATYDGSRSYESDLKDYKINKEITNVNEARTQIWDVLGKKYDDNTKLRKFYFDELVQQNTQLEKQYLQLNKLVAEVTDLKTTNTTLERKIKKDKYDINKSLYYEFMYKVLIFIQLASVIFLLLGITKKLPKYTALVIVFILLVACLGFIFYYAFIGNTGRDQFTWDKLRARDINRSGYGNNNRCPKPKKKKKKTEQEERLDEEIKDIIADSKYQGPGGKQCMN